MVVKVRHWCAESRLAFLGLRRIHCNWVFVRTLRKSVQHPGGYRTASRTWSLSKFALSPVTVHALSEPATHGQSNGEGYTPCLVWA